MAILTFAAVLRFVWLTADPPNTAGNGVGVVWHDEGAWVHNARNRALWGVWRTDDWNPVFLSPVFTGLEYAAFRLAGVGLRQARLVPAVSGLVAIAFLMAGVRVLAGRRGALIAGALLAVNYAFVMWNRAALMESTMTTFIVVSWAACALAAQRRGWGIVSGAAAALAFFTKASAAFFVAALLAETCGAGLLRLWSAGVRTPGSSDTNEPQNPRTPEPQNPFVPPILLGLSATAAIIGLSFVLPHWSEFRFYNWQMSVARKPEYTLRALAMRASWLPLVHDFFTWMWPVLVASALSIVEIATRARTARPAERLLVLWVLVGLVELIVHDSGNERRYVMFLPALIALAVVWLLRERRPGAAVAARPGRWPAALLALGLGYLVAGSAIRMAWLASVRAGHLHTVVVLSMVAALGAAAAVAAGWGRFSLWLGAPRVPPALLVAVIGTTMAFDGVRFTAWARARQTLNYEASVAVGRLLPPDTLVQGKLANGLALENRIRPLFIGHDFGNYADRLRRDDVRYVLTYTSPSVGFESQAGSGLIQEILERYPSHRTIATFPVDETGGPDRAALIDKVPGP